MPKDEFINKSTKDSAEINDRYRKLMKEESELLQDLRKLQLKKQLLVKRSKQLKDEQVIKLNLDLQKEKEIRVDLEKKLTNLEKKLNQLEKEIDHRKDKNNLICKNSSNESAIRNNKFSLKKDWLKEESKFSNRSKDNLNEDKKKKSNEDAKKVIKSKKNLVASTEQQPVNVNNKQTIILNRESQSNNLVIKSLPKNVALKRCLEPKNVEQLPKNFSILADSHLSNAINVETNTEPIEVITSTTQSNANLPNEQQVVNSNLNMVIRDILDRQIQETTTNNQTNSNAQSNEVTIGRLDANTTNTISNTSTTYSDWSDSSNSVQIMSPNSTNVNYSPSSSDNFSF